MLVQGVTPLLFLASGAVAVFNLLAAGGGGVSTSAVDDSTGKGRKSNTLVAGSKAHREQQVWVCAGVKPCVNARACVWRVCVCRRQAVCERACVNARPCVWRVVCVGVKPCVSARA